MMATDGQRAARSAPGPVVRVFRAWRVLRREQRVSAIAAMALWLTMFLPWYSETGLALGKNGVHAGGVSLTAWSAFSWVEAAVLLVSLGVLALLFARGERRAFHLPGGDGGLIMVAGAWIALLVIYRMFDTNGIKVADGEITTGIDWGIFMALAAAVWLAYTGVSMRRAHRAEPTLADDPTVHLRGLRQRARAQPPRAPDPIARERSDEPPREHRGPTREDAEQLSFDLPRERDE
jgi:hypothetical protein